MKVLHFTFFVVACAATVGLSSSFLVPDLLGALGGGGAGGVPQLPLPLKCSNLVPLVGVKLYLVSVKEILPDLTALLSVSICTNGTITIVLAVRVDHLIYIKAAVTVNLADPAHLLQVLVNITALAQPEDLLGFSTNATVDLFLPLLDLSSPNLPPQVKQIEVLVTDLVNSIEDLLNGLGIPFDQFLKIPMGLLKLLDFCIPILGINVCLQLILGLVQGVLSGVGLGSLLG